LSPDSASSGFHLFPNLKEFVSGKRCVFNGEVVEVMNGYCHSLPASLPGRITDAGDKVC
jgi:hypothetical protein